MKLIQSVTQDIEPVEQADIPAIWLFAIIFFWTPPHFWALSLLIQKDYEKAKIQMLPVVKGEVETRKQILLYSLVLLALTLGLFAFGIMGYLYLVGAVILGGGLVYLAIRLWRTQTKKSASPSSGTRICTWRRSSPSWCWIG